MWQKIKNIYHLLQALFSALYFKFPSKKITVIGVTGTDGKTTTVNMVYHILKSANKKVSMISSVNAVVAGKNFDTGFHVSTPSPWQVQKYLRKAVQNGDEYFVIEATSHGLDQNRLAFVDFEVGVVTNITSEHLDYHKNWQNYASSKLKLLKNSKIKIVNMDDKSYGFLTKKIRGHAGTYSLQKGADATLNNFPLHLAIDGTYNLSNALAACLTADAVNIPKKQILSALSNFKGVEGRLDKIDLGQNFKVYIDFAHTANSLENVLKLLKSKLPKSSRLIAVFGSAGRRDTQKRPKMGKAAAEIADIIVLTSEDPRGENPKEICEQIAQGMGGKVLNKGYHIIVDRQEAIEFAVSLAKAGDIIGIFGKGHEKSMSVSGRELPWSDYEAAKSAIQKVLKKS